MANTKTIVYIDSRLFAADWLSGMYTLGEIAKRHGIGYHFAKEMAAKVSVETKRADDLKRSQLIDYKNELYNYIGSNEKDAILHYPDLVEEYRRLVKYINLNT